MEFIQSLSYFSVTPGLVFIIISWVSILTMPFIVGLLFNIHSTLMCVCGATEPGCLQGSIAAAVYITLQLVNNGFKAYTTVESRSAREYSSLPPFPFLKRQHAPLSCIFSTIVECALVNVLRHAIHFTNTSSVNASHNASHCTDHAKKLCRSIFCCLQ